LSGQRGSPEEEKRRFLREAQAVSQLDHPNICTLYEIDETGDGTLFLAMALYEGETLRERLDRGPLPVAQAAEIAVQVAAGLAQAHKRGIVHRDVKPANIALTGEGQVKLLDFGIARLSGQSRLTRAGMAVGTAAYMAPEQFRGQPAEPRSDVWGLGVVIYEMVTGRVPFGGASNLEMVRAILQSDPAPMSQLLPGVPERLERIVARALSKPPAGRYASMEALAADLRSLGGISLPEEDPDRTLLDVPVHEDGLHATGSPDRLLGRQVGPYRVSELLGSGGMGVVYKAEDTRLARTVALKFLPPELTRDPEAKARFTQEARAASSLDHPNICTILDLGETIDGQLYLAMPCYDGETLRSRIESGPLPVEEALDVALQTARGLAKAHRNGIVHRDLKPANLIVTGDGVVKILDFGLAKLVGSAAISRTGSSLGTPAYMSPEQARGGEVDPRTDLWSLGVVLYEMLAGRRPFRGEREQAVIYAILNERPQPLREVRPDVSGEVERIVDRLLAKDPEDRYPSTEAPLAEIRALLGEAVSTSIKTRPVRREGRPWAWGIAALVAMALAGGAALWLRANRPEIVSGNVSRLTNQPGIETFPSLSPDGDFFVYAKAASPDNLDVYLQRVRGGNPINLTADSPVDDTQPAYSPDGRQIAFRSEREGGGIFLMGATGESARRLTDFGYNPAWSPDGREIAFSTANVNDPRIRPARGELWRVDVTTDRKKLVAQADAVQPSWSPQGLRIAYWGTLSGKRVLFSVAAQGGKPVQVTDDSFLNWDPVWSRDGRHLYFASDRGGTMNLWRVPVDEASGRVLGAPQPVSTPSQSSSLLSLSRDERRILYASNDSTSSLEQAGFDPVAGQVTGSLLPVSRGLKSVSSAEVSPDGRWIVFDVSSPYEDLFLIHPDGSGLRRLTDDVYKDRNPRWSPAG
ncbi:MAG: protein kinase domain-containing protein, partial [Thermoanaerobaculia bacterium]